MGSLQRCASGTETTESECREAAGELGLGIGKGAWVPGIGWRLDTWSYNQGVIFPSGCWQNRYTNTALNGPNNRVWFNKDKNSVGQGHGAQYYR